MANLKRIEQKLLEISECGMMDQKYYEFLIDFSRNALAVIKGHAAGNLYEEGCEQCKGFLDKEWR